MEFSGNFNKKFTETHVHSTTYNLLSVDACLNVIATSFPQENQINNYVTSIMDGLSLWIATLIVLRYKQFRTHSICGRNS